MKQKKDTKTSLVTAAGQLAVGTRKHFTDGSQKLPLGNASVTVDELVNQLQVFIGNRTAVIAAQAAAKAKVEAENAQAPALVTLIKAFIAFVQVAFAGQLDVLADFGVEPRKRPAPLTAEQKAVAAERRKATRAARGTLGPRKKLAVKGHVTAKIVVTPDPAPADAPAAAANAPANGKA